MISVIMSTYREKTEYVQLAIQSILEQTYQDFEFLILLDDPQNEQMKALVQQYAKQDRRIKIVPNEKNQGLTMALNKILPFVQGEYIARMDADDISDEKRFELQLRYLKENNLDLVGARKQNIDEEGRIIPNGVSSYCNSAVVMKKLRAGASVTHSLWFAKREVYDKLCGYRNMPRCEDYDFLLRALKNGFRIGICSSVLLKCRINSTGISRTGMLEQELAAKYLRRRYKEVDNVSIDEVNQYVLERATPRSSEKYKRAIVFLDQAAQLKNDYPIKSAILTMKCLGTSKYAARKVLHIFRQKYIERTAN